MAELFLSLLGQGQDAHTFQTFHETDKDVRNSKRARFSARIRHGRLRDHWDELYKLNMGDEPIGVHVSVNVIDGTPDENGRVRRRASDVLAPRAFVLDFDDHESYQRFSHGGARRRGVNLDVRTPRGRHLWWLIDPKEATGPEALAHYHKLQKAFVRRFDVDPEVAKLNQTLRLPGFWHRKGDPRLIELVSHSTDILWTFDAFTDFFKIRQDEIDPPRPSAQANRDLSSYPLELRLKRCRACMAHVDPAIEGSGGWHHTKGVCGIGHDFGLSIDEFWPILCEWNARCQPPWDEPELREKTEVIYDLCSPSDFGRRLLEDSPEWVARQQRREREIKERERIDEEAWAATLAIADSYAEVDHAAKRPSELEGPDHWRAEAFERADDVAQHNVPHDVVPRLEVRGGVQVVDYTDPITAPAEAVDAAYGTSFATPTIEEVEGLELGYARGWGPDAPADPEHAESPRNPNDYLDNDRTILRGPDEFPMTDHGNGQRFVARYKGKVAYVAKYDKWLIWDGRRWRMDTDSEEMDAELHAAGFIEEYAKNVSRDMMSRTAEIADEQLLKAWRSWCKSSDSVSGSKNMLKSASTMRGIAFAPGHFDRDPDLLCTPQTVLDLKHGDMLPHAREHRITKMTSVTPADIDCPTWLAFLDRVMGRDTDMIDFLQRAVGYSLTGETSEQVFFSMWGTGRNGKTTFLNILRMLAGEYAKNTDFSAFEEKKSDSIRNDLVRLNNARIVTAVEPSEQRRLAEAVIKRITGDEPITARFLYGEFFDFYPKFKLWLSSNHKIEIRGTDEGIWRRIMMIPFTVRIPKREVDRDLPRKLERELPGIMHWAWRGAQQWYRDGLRPPDKVIKANAEYRNDMDAIGDFLRANLRPCPDGRVAAKDLYERYREWCSTTGERWLSMKVFGQRMNDRPEIEIDLEDGSTRMMEIRHKRSSKGKQYLDVELTEPTNRVPPQNAPTE